MSAKRTIFNQRRGKQCGAVLMVMLVIMIIGAVTIFVMSLNSSALQIERDKITADALAKAKEALIGRAVADANRPGSLPCPDTNNDGSAELLSGNNCPSYIGRLPWKTLGLPDLRDGSGEKLWYALSPNFRDDNSNPINSDNKGTLLVYDNSGTILLTPPGSEAVAIIFAPGNIVVSQQRDTTANQNSPQNYLDIGPNTINNAVAAGPFIAADKTGSFNDRLMIIRTRDLLPVVEKRAAKEVQGFLANYRVANGVYPYPANFNNCTFNSSNPLNSNCDSNETVCRGRFPLHSDALSYPDWANTLPAWFVNNGWFNVIYYSAGNSRLSPAVAGCNTNLTVSGTSAAALFFMPGTPLGSITRPSNNLLDYLEDAENQNMDDIYVKPGTTTTSNDSLYTLP